MTTTTPRIVSFPQTTYFVALVYQHRRTPGRVVLAPRIIMVSGDNPLTRDEVISRARVMAEADWVPDHGPFDDYSPCIETVQWMTQS